MVKVEHDVVGPVQKGLNMKSKDEMMKYPAERIAFQVKIVVSDRSLLPKLKGVVPSKEITNVVVTPYVFRLDKDPLTSKNLGRGLKNLRTGEKVDVGTTEMFIWDRQGSSSRFYVFAPYSDELPVYELGGFGKSTTKLSAINNERMVKTARLRETSALDGSINEYSTGGVKEICLTAQSMVENLRVTNRINGYSGKFPKPLQKEFLEPMTAAEACEAADGIATMLATFYKQSQMRRDDAYIKEYKEKLEKFDAKKSPAMNF